MRHTGLSLVVGLAALSGEAGCKKDGSEPAAAMIASATLPNEAPAVEISKSAKIAAVGMHTGV